MSERALPERLRQEILGDLRPVRPLPRPGLRALEVVPWAIALFLLVPAVWPLRADAEELGWTLVWGAAIGEALGGLALITLALHEAVPGGGIGRVRAVLALAGGAALQLAVGLATRANGAMHPEALAHRGPACLAAQTVLAVPILAFSLWLVARALPVRPRWAGALCGLGAGIVADGVWHLICPRIDLAHVLVWHGGATLLMAGAGWLLGVLWESRQARQSVQA